MENIDDNYIWQRRIHHGIRYQKGAALFPESVEIGLEFNAALERKEKLHLCVLTNGVMLEICDFARTVTKSEKYFLFEMLDFNFDLGVDRDNDLHCYDYASRVHAKIKQLKDQIKTKTHRGKEAFPLPDPSTVASTGSEVSGRYYPKRNKMMDSSVLTDGNKSRWSSESHVTQSNGVVSSMLSVKRKGGVQFKRAADLYPFCRELGVTLALQPNETPKQKLDPSLVNNGVMLELLDFSRVLCGTHTQIIHDLVKQNFGHELDKIQFRLQFHKLMERKSSCLKAEDRDRFRKELFQVRIKKQGQRCKKRQKPDSDYQQLETLIVATKRRETLRKSDGREPHGDRDLSYTCPIDYETETLSGSEGRPEKGNLESCLSETAEETKLLVPMNVKQEEEEVIVSSVQPPNNGLRSRGFKFHSEEDSLSRLFSEDTNKDVKIETVRQRLWRRRASRSKQILASSRAKDPFVHCREIALDFNVGSGSKQSLDLQLLTNWVLLEVFKFATAMRKSIQTFLFDIVDNNFKLFLQDEQHRRNFIFYMMTKEKSLQNHPARNKTEFLSRAFSFPEVYIMVDVTSVFQTEQELDSEQQMNWDSSLSPTSQETDTEHYPFCQKLGLNLWSTETRLTRQKLDLSDLTTGAMLEIFSFVRELCGAVHETVNNILEHNFDLDLHSAATEASQVIQRWYATQKSLMKKQYMSPKINSWLNTVVPLNGHSRQSSPPATSNGPKNPDSTDSSPSTGRKQQENKVSEYHTCKEIGLDLDVGSKSKDKTKLDLRVLTRGVLFEMHQYVEQNCRRYVPALYEILEYNFDLSSQSHRKVEFAWSIASQVIAMVGKKGRKGEYLKRAFELPMEASESSRLVCKEEPEDVLGQPDLSPDHEDIVFVRKLQPVDIEVEVE